MSEQIENKFKTVVAASTMSVPMYKYQGHTMEQTLPCTVYGLYNPKTGTVVVTEVWCDDHVIVQPAQLSAAEIEQFEYALKAGIVTAFD